MNGDAGVRLFVSLGVIPAILTFCVFLVVASDVLRRRQVARVVRELRSAVDELRAGRAAEASTRIQEELPSIANSSRLPVEFVQPLRQLTFACRRALDLNSHGGSRLEPIYANRMAELLLRVAFEIERGYLTGVTMGIARIEAADMADKSDQEHWLTDYSQSARKWSAPEMPSDSRELDVLDLEDSSDAPSKELVNRPCPYYWFSQRDVPSPITGWTRPQLKGYLRAIESAKPRRHRLSVELIRTEARQILDANKGWALGTFRSSQSAYFRTLEESISAIQIRIDQDHSVQNKAQDVASNPATPQRGTLSKSKRWA